MDEFDRLDDLETQIETLDDSFGAATDMAAAFNSEMTRVRAAFTGTGFDVASLERGISGGLRKAIKGAAIDGDSLSESLTTLAETMINTAFNAAVNPVADHFGNAISQGIGGLVGGLSPFAKGASFARGRVQPFASGGVVSGPVAFPMRGGAGLMGEAGPEAIMPLSVVMNVTTADAESFRRSQGQIAAQLGRVIGRGQRNR